MRKLLNEQQENWLFNNYKGLTNQELTNRINERFGLELSIEQIKRVKNRNKLNSGLTGRFEKGCKPWNKNKKGYMGANRTSFKKGMTPPNWKPVGSERVGKHGYIQIKVCDKKGSKNYQLKHRYIYEQHHGEIPKGYVVIFLDQNNRNFDINNLRAIARKDLARINKYMKLTGDKDINNALINLAELETKISEAGYHTSNSRN